MQKENIVNAVHHIEDAHNSCDATLEDIWIAYLALQLRNAVNSNAIEDVKHYPTSH